MSITVTINMKYTRPGELVEGNVLSAHNPLIWEFQDGAIAANPTATVQFVVKDNDGVTIYTSAVFPAYLFSYVGSLAKFRFDGTEIIKHIIANYFYNETSKIIEPENYGSFVELTVKTYDNAILEDTEIFNYFIFHAVNQIGDEYGTNIPRLFYNDTEEIAHFLGFPNHVFFYSPIDLDTEDSVIEFLVRNSKKAMVEFLHSSGGLAHPVYAVVGMQTHSPTLWHYNKKTYGVWMKRGGAGYNVDSMIFAFDHETGVISDSYLCNTGVVAATDPHAYPSVIVADDNRIIVAREKLVGVTENDHNSVMWINRSDNVEDESSWVNALAHNANYWSEVGQNAGDNRLAYPVLAKTTNGYLYLWARSGSDQHKVRIFQSQDDGVSWDGFGTGETDGLEVMAIPTGGPRAHASQLKHVTDTKLYMVCNPWNSVDKHNRVYFLWSTDGSTWRNVDNSWNKNVAATSAITQAEAEANMKVCGADAPEVYYFNSGYIDDDGYPHILLGRSHDDGVTYFLSHYYWDGSAWLHNDFSVPNYSPAASTSVLYQKNGYLEIMLKRTVGWKNIFSIYRSSDYFKSLTLIRHIDPTDTVNYAAITVNQPEAAYTTFLFFHYNDAASSDMYVYAEADIFEEYGTLGQYIHDLNLSKFTLNKDTYQCNVYYDPADPELIKTYNLTIFEPCENAVYIRFLTKDGYYMYWAFSPYPFEIKTGDKIGNVINNFSEMALANSRNLPIGYRNSFNKISVIASAVPIVFRRKLMEIFISPAVYIWDGSIGEYEYEKDWVLLNRVEGSHDLREKMKHDNFECTLVLPENYTQTLSGQNL